MTPAMMIARLRRWNPRMKMWVNHGTGEERYYINNWLRLTGMEVVVVIDGVPMTQFDAGRVLSTKVYVDPENGLQAYAYPRGETVISQQQIIDRVAAAIEALPDPYESESL